MATNSFANFCCLSWNVSLISAQEFTFSVFLGGQWEVFKTELYWKHQGPIQKYVVQNTAAVMFPSLSLKLFSSLLISDWCCKLSRHLHWASTIQPIDYFFPWEVTTNSEAIDVYKEINLFHPICIPLQPSTMNVIYRHVAQLSQGTCSSLFISKFGHFAIQIPSFSNSINHCEFRKKFPLQVN